MNRQIKVLSGSELALIRESMKYLDLSATVKLKVHDAITAYARESNYQEAKKCADAE